MNYQTSIRTPQAVSPLGGLGAPSPFATPGSHADVYASMAAKNQNDYARQVQLANAQQLVQDRQMQQQMAMRGLQMLNQQRDNEQELANRQQSMYGNYVNSLLGGLFT